MTVLETGRSARMVFLVDGVGCLVADGSSMGYLANICPGAVFRWFSLDGLIEEVGDSRVDVENGLMVVWLILLRLLGYKKGGIFSF